MTDPTLLSAAMQASETLLFAVAGIVVLLGMIVVALPARVFHAPADHSRKRG